MINKPTILDFDECYSIGEEISEAIYSNVREKVTKIESLDGKLSSLEIIAMELSMSDGNLSDLIPNIRNIFWEEYCVLDELQKHCLFIYLMIPKKDDVEIIESLLWTFEEDLENLGHELVKKLADSSVRS